MNSNQGFVIEEVKTIQLCYCDKNGMKHILKRVPDNPGQRLKMNELIRSYDGVQIDYAMMDLTKPYNYDYP